MRDSHYRIIHYYYFYYTYVRSTETRFFFFYFILFIVRVVFKRSSPGNDMRSTDGEKKKIPWPSDLFMTYTEHKKKNLTNATRAHMARTSAVSGSAGTILVMKFIMRFFF